MVNMGYKWCSSNSFNNTPYFKIGFQASAINSFELQCDENIAVLSSKIITSLCFSSNQWYKYDHGYLERECRRTSLWLQILAWLSRTFDGLISEKHPSLIQSADHQVLTFLQF